MRVLKHKKQAAVSMSKYYSQLIANNTEKRLQKQLDCLIFDISELKRKDFRQYSIK